MILTVGLRDEKAEFLMQSSHFKVAYTGRIDFSDIACIFSFSAFYIDKCHFRVVKMHLLLSRRSLCRLLVKNASAY